MDPKITEQSYQRITAIEMFLFEKSDQGGLLGQGSTKWKGFSIKIIQIKSLNL